MPSTPTAAPARSSHALVVRCAANQSNVVSSAQMRELGIGRRWVAHNVRTGLLAVVAPGVFAVGLDPADLPRASWAQVALLRTSSPAALSHETAAEWLGIWTRGASDIHVVSTGRTSGVPQGDGRELAIRAHRTLALDPADVVQVGPLAVTGALRTIAELGARLTRFQVAHVIWNALYAELVDIPSLRARLDSQRHVPGTAAARAALALVELGSCGTKSASEDEFVAIVERARLPMPLVNVLGAADLPGVRLDFVWLRERVVLELDGRHHAAMPGIARGDRAVFQRLRSDGWRAIRLHYSRVWSDPIGVSTLVASALER